MYGFLRKHRITINTTCIAAKQCNNTITSSTTMTSTKSAILHLHNRFTKTPLDKRFQTGYNTTKNYSDSSMDAHYTRGTIAKVL